MIELKKVSYWYRDFNGKKRQAINNVSLKIEESERVVLLGINGSGKSTLLKIIDALLFVQEGEYRFHGEVINKNNFKKLAKRFRQEVGFLMQDPAMMLFNPTVQDEILFGLQGWSEEKRKMRLEEIVEIFGLQDLLHLPPHYLSGGERQKVALAAILAPKPKLLLMDEPSSHLDPPTTGWLIDLLAQLKTTLLVATHNLSLAPEFGERVVVMESGGIVYDGELKSFLKDESLLGEAKLLHKHFHRHGYFIHSHYHLHDWDL